MFKTIAASVALALATAAAHATMLPLTGTGGSPVAATATNYGGTLLAATGPQFITTTTFNGAYTESVYADNVGFNPFCSGCLDFVIQASNLGPASTSPIIESVTNSNFSTFLVDAGYQPGNQAAVVPTGVQRSATGGVITFNFSLMAGLQTDALVIHTNALAFSIGNLSLQDGTAGTGPIAYQPAGTPVLTPEPSSLLLLGTGLLGAAGAARRKLGF